jgi:hypothetical protein
MRALCDVLPKRRAEVLALVQRMTLRTFHAAELLWRQGDKPSFLAVVEHVRKCCNASLFARFGAAPSAERAVAQWLARQGELAVILDFEGRQKTIETVGPKFCVLNPSIESFPPRFVNRAVSGLAGARCAARFIVPRALARIAVCFDCWMCLFVSLFVPLFVCLFAPSLAVN